MLNFYFLPKGRMEEGTLSKVSVISLNHRIDFNVTLKMDSPLHAFIHELIYISLHVTRIHMN